MAKRRVSLVVTDLDNTLWDWFAIWYQSFSALLAKLVEQSGVPQAVLEAQIREVHQARGTSEYSHLIQELPSLQELHPNEDLAEVYDEAVHAFRSARKEAMALYPGVLETIETLRRSGVTVVGYTESLAYYTSYRIRALGLDGLIQYLYSPPDHDFPMGIRPEDLRSLPEHEYVLQETAHRSTPVGVEKPDSTLLRAIVGELGSAESTAYVGDSLMKDIAMAQDLGVADVHARYGVVQGHEEYELLRRVSHWTDDDVERERRMHARPSVEPTFLLDKSMDELLPQFDWGA